VPIRRGVRSKQGTQAHSNTLALLVLQPNAENQLAYPCDTSYGISLHCFPLAEASVRQLRTWLYSDSISKITKKCQNVIAPEIASSYGA
jgi:hypothetical protein